MHREDVSTHPVERILRFGRRMADNGLLAWNLHDVSKYDDLLRWECKEEGIMEGDCEARSAAQPVEGGCRLMWTGMCRLWNSARERRKSLTIARADSDPVELQVAEGLAGMIRL